MKVEFSMFMEGDEIRLTGEAVEQNAKTTVVKAQLPEDFGGRLIKIKRHNKKHNVVIVED
jgi:hypothetical protein